MAKNKEHEKFRGDELKMERLTNADLVCRDCIFAFDDSKVPGNISKCGKYGWKPAEIMLGGKCDEYEQV